MTISFEVAYTNFCTNSIEVCNYDYESYATVINIAMESFYQLSQKLSMELSLLLKNEYQYFIDTNYYKLLVSSNSDFLFTYHKDYRSKLFFLLQTQEYFDIIDSELVSMLCKLDKFILQHELQDSLLLIWNILRFWEGVEAFEFLIFTIEQMNEEWFIRDICFYLYQYTKVLQTWQIQIIIQKINISKVSDFKEEINSYFLKDTLLF